MTAPKHQVVQAVYQNKDSDKPLIIPTLVLCNTPDEELQANIKWNSSQKHPWLKAGKVTTAPAVFVGGGPSVEDYVHEIIALQNMGATIFAMNGSSRWARARGIRVDYQVMADAREASAELVDTGAPNHLFASQCHPATFAAAPAPTLWHLELGSIEALLDQERVRKGGYVLIGGGSSVGNSALCVAFAMGYREMHIFGYDSCQRDNRAHAYPQPLNEGMPCVHVIWNGKKFKAPLAMKAQAEKFQLTSQALKQEGCTLAVYGEGLLQEMYRTKSSHLSEQEKYQRMWNFDTYRTVSPGELVVPAFFETVHPTGMVLDFGCGTGRAALKMMEAGLEVLGIDFADNCRDEEAMGIPFLQWDLTRPIPARANFGFCSDVMEHIPTADVGTVIANIMEAAEKVFFQISTREDHCGELIGHPLHLTVEKGEWWEKLILSQGHEILWAVEDEVAAYFVVKRSPALQ